jgi:hypothetical protein
MNTNKFLRHNLSQPIAKRIHWEDVGFKVAVHKKRGGLQALRAQVHIEIAPQLEAKRNAEDWTNHVGGEENQGFVFELKKYNQIYSSGNNPSDLASVNDSFHSLRVAGNNRAEVETLKIAGRL